MTPILVALLLQSAPPVPASQQVDLPVSLDRVREGLARPGRFDPPPSRPPGRPLFQVRTEQRVFVPFFDDPWTDRSTTPPWVRPTMPSTHYDFLAAVTPEEFRAATLYPCCDVLPLIGALTDFVGDRIKAAKQKRAKREVEKAMRDAGIKK